MIISFEQNADFYVEMAENAREEGNYPKALRYLADAVTRERSSYNLMSVAMLYQDMQRHDFAVEECFALLGSVRLDSEELADIYLLLSESLGKLGYLMQSWYYLSKRAVFEEGLDEEDSIFEEIESVIEEISLNAEKRAATPKLLFSDEMREQQYAKCYRHATTEYLLGNYKKSLEYSKIIPKTAECYLENIILMSKCYVYKDKINNAIKCWHEAIQINSNEGSAINGLAIFSDDDEYVRNLIQEFESTRDEDIRYVINAACLKEMYEKALSLANKLLDKDYYNPTTHFILGAVNYNMGKKDIAYNIFKDILWIYNDKYPSKYMLSYFKRHKSISLLFEHVPHEIANRITNSIKKEIKSYGFKSSFMSSAAFRQGVLYTLSKNFNEELSLQLIGLIENECNNAMVLFLRQLLTKPNVHFEIRRKVISILLQTLKRGHINVINEGIFNRLSLRVPPSYSAFSEKLRTVYCDAFAFLATSGISFEKDLSKVVEKVFISNFEIANLNATSAAIAYVTINSPNFFTLEGLANVFDTDKEIITDCIKDIQQILSST